MLSPFRFAGIITAIFCAGGPALAQQIAPADSGVTIEKQIIVNGPSRSVKYFVTGGSPQLQALVRRVEWAENELSVIEQLQLLKLDTVVTERRLTAVRSAQLTTPYFPTGFLPHSFGAGYGYEGGSYLQRALSGQLAYEATPQAALQLIGFLEQQQTQLDVELKALAPKEKKAAQGTVDMLRPRLAVFRRGDVPAPKPEPVAAGVMPTALRGHVSDQAKFGMLTQSGEHGTRAPAKTNAGLPRIQMPLNPLALQQMVQQQFAFTQQRLMQMQ